MNEWKQFTGSAEQITEIMGNPSGAEIQNRLQRGSRIFRPGVELDKAWLQTLVDDTNKFTPYLYRLL